MGDGRSPKRARGGRPRDGTLNLPPPPETPKAEFVPVKPLTQTEMAVLGLGEIWEKTQREASMMSERSPEMESVYEELGFQKKQLFWRPMEGAWAHPLRLETSSFPKATQSERSGRRFHRFMFWVTVLHI